MRKFKRAPEPHECQVAIFMIQGLVFVAVVYAISLTTAFCFPSGLFAAIEFPDFVKSGQHRCRRHGYTASRKKVLRLLLLLNLAGAQAVHGFEESSRMTLPDCVRHKGRRYSSSPCGDSCAPGTSKSEEGVGPHPLKWAEDNLHAGRCDDVDDPNNGSRSQSFDQDACACADSQLQQLYLWNELQRQREHGNRTRKARELDRGAVPFFQIFQYESGADTSHFMKMPRQMPRAFETLLKKVRSRVHLDRNAKKPVGDLEEVQRTVG